MSTANQGIAPVRTSHAKLGEIGKLKTPSGKTLDELSGDEIARLVTELNIPGASHANGREANAKLYAAHLDSIGEAGGRNAVDAWLSEKAKEQ